MYCLTRRKRRNQFIRHCCHSIPKTINWDLKKKKTHSTQKKSVNSSIPLLSVSMTFLQMKMTDFSQYSSIRKENESMYQISPESVSHAIFFCRFILRLLCRAAALYLANCPFTVLLNALIMAATKTNHDDFKHVLTFCWHAWPLQI